MYRGKVTIIPSLKVYLTPCGRENVSYIAFGVQTIGKKKTLNRDTLTQRRSQVKLSG